MRFYYLKFCLFSLSLLSQQIIITELCRARVKNSSETHPLKVWNTDIPFWVVQAYKSIGMFGFGAAVSQLLTDVGKYTIGRLRPHFFDVSSRAVGGCTVR